MPLIKWKSFRIAEPDREYLALLTSLELKRYWHVPRFLRLSSKVQEQLVQSEGLLGFSLLAELPSKRYWTLSVWEDERKLTAFRTNSPHKEVMVDMRPDEGDTKFTVIRWKISGSAVPPSFADAFEQRDTD